MITAGRALLVLAGLVVGLVLAETVARELSPPVASAFSYRIPDPELGWRLEPGARITVETRDYRHRVVINSHGWRDRERRYEKPPGTTRIVVLGDSFIEAYSVPLEQSFAQQLERELAGAEVLNLGVGGYGTLQETLAFARDGVRYAPDLVLLGFFAANDLRNNSYTLEASLSGTETSKVFSRPFLRPADYAGPGDDAWTLRRVDYARALRHYEAAVARPPSGWWRRLALYDLSRAAFARSAAADRADDAGADRVGGSLALLGSYRCEEHREYARAWETTRRILARLQRDVEAAGARLVVFSVPALAEVDPREQRRLLRGLRRPELHCFERAPAYERLAALLGDYEVPYVDLLPAFRRAAREGQRELFYPSDRHWNQAGHALAAREVRAALAERGLAR